MRFTVLPRILPQALLVAAPALAGAQGHATREPQAVDASPFPVAELAIASDEELSVVLYREASSGPQVFAVTSDGRGIEWSAPVAVASSSLSKVVQRDSVQVRGSRAFAAWLEHGAGGPGVDRVRFESFANGAWDPDGNGNTTIELGYPAGGSVTAWKLLAKPGINGSVYVYVLAAVSTAGGPSRILLSVSPVNGSVFAPAVPVATAPPGADVEGLALDAQLAEVHVAWSDDRALAGIDQAFYRRGIVDFIGGVAWLEGERLISPGPGNVLGDLVAAVNGDKVGIGFRQSDAGLSDRYRIISSTDSGASLSAAQAVDVPGLDVVAIDLEISGETFVAAWEQLKPNQKHEIRRGLSFTGSGFGNEVISGSGGLDTDARDPMITRSVGLPDGALIVFVDQGPSGASEVYTSFSDQEHGAEWHDEYPAVSEGEQAGVSFVLAPRAAYNHRYYNFLVAWLQDTPDAPGVPSAHVGGYRPPEVRVEGWIAGQPTSVVFAVDHLPFEDLFSFILLGSGYAGAPGLPLPDGRFSGLAFHPVLTPLAINQFNLFVAPNDPSARGSTTAPIGPLLLPAGLPLAGVGVSWGPFGELHVVSDVFEVVAEIPAP